ncbi:MAG: 6,7-dimethyl-8-ribityllumazine synthase [Luteitalea sp.]|nr:6,7-dimethyl-8-ribityllumazine synthase [Luteitalea sp.]
MHPLEQAHGLRVALVVSRFNDYVTDRLRLGALEALKTAGVGATEAEIFEVPGAFEIPFAARLVATTGRFDAVICLGCLIRGETPHFDVIASAVAHGITEASGATGVPMTFGVLTTNNAEEALARAGQGPANKGYEAAAAAISIALLARRVGDRSSPPQDAGV